MHAASLAGMIICSLVAQMPFPGQLSGPYIPAEHEHVRRDTLQACSAAPEPTAAPCKPGCTGLQVLKQSLEQHIQHSLSVHLAQRSMLQGLSVPMQAWTKREGGFTR